MTDRSIHSRERGEVPQSHPSSLGSSVRSERDHDSSNRTERSSGDGGIRAEKKKLKDKDKKPRKKRKVPPLDSSDTGVVGKNSRNRNNPAYVGEGAFAEEGGSSSRKTSTKKGKKKKEGKFKEKKSSESDRNDPYHSSISSRRLPTASSRSADYSDDRYEQGSGNGHSSHQQPTTSGRVKKNKKKVRAAAAAAAMMAESGSSPGGNPGCGYSAAQIAVNDMMRRALEEDQYSAVGSVVDTDSSDEEDDDRNILMITSGTTSSKRGSSASAREDNTSLVRLDRNVILSAMRKRLRIEGMKSAGGGNIIDTKSTKRIRNIHIEDEYQIDGKVINNDEERAGSSGRGGNRKKKRKKEKRVGSRAHRDIDQQIEIQPYVDDQEGTHDGDKTGILHTEIGSPEFDENMDDEFDGEETSIFGQTAGSSNSTWVECDKCKKWRRLRGVVDARKLPSKWYCSMNKTDPERAKCTAPEEEYETPNTPESATDQRTRKHLRLWVRRLQCNDAYEARLPTMTRKMKKINATSAKDPYEWIRCCNPSCGKWRSLLRVMDASSVIESAKNGEWFCVLNTWDEKTASCAAPQENLPAIGCPPWILQDEKAE